MALTVTVDGLGTDAGVSTCGRGSRSESCMAIGRKLRHRGTGSVLLSWCEYGREQAKLFVEDMLSDDLEIVRRIAIYLVSEQWEDLRALLPLIVKPDFFNAGHLHELYNLLSRRFPDFSANEKKDQTVKSIADISIPSKANNPTHVRRKSSSGGYPR